MRELKLISRLPKLSIIQAQGANPFYRSVREFGGKKLEPMTADTLATAIRIGNPASWKKALRVLQATGGEVEQVTEVEIAVAKAEIGADGIGCEPASAVTLAGLKKLRRSGFVKPGESVVLILTGHALKDPDFTIKFHRGDLVRRNVRRWNARRDRGCPGKISAARPGRARCRSGGRHCRSRCGREKFVAVRRKLVYKTQFSVSADGKGFCLGRTGLKPLFLSFRPVLAAEEFALS